ncbi:MAG: lamin tail domain-containing protein [Verrucomicrobiia bacterium]
MMLRILRRVFAALLPKESRRRWCAKGWLVVCVACAGGFQAYANDGVPRLEALIPEAGAVLHELFAIEAAFDRPVIGVEADDLLINGTGATNVIEVEAGRFVFAFPQPADGPVSVSWRTDHGIRDAEQGVEFEGGSWSYVLDAENVPAGIVISEFMAANTNGLRDEDGDNSDWIEIHNASETDVNLDGWFLTDDLALLSKWRFPDVTVAPREFLVVFASEKGKTNVTGRLHTNFKLSAEGEYLALVSPAMTVVSAFAQAFPPQQPDVSYGRAPGEPGVSGYFLKPTPGAANSESGAGFAPEATFSRQSGTFLEPFRLEMSAASTSASIRYTLDGSLPTNSSPQYLAPILITNSVQVRARTFQDGLLPGLPRTETFLLLSNNLAGFTSDLPVLVIHSLGKGAPGSSRADFYTPVGLRTWTRRDVTDQPADTCHASGH